MPENNVKETPEAQSDLKADHAKARELKERWSAQLNKKALEDIDIIVNNVVFGPQRTERTDAEKAAQLEKSRDEVRGLIDAQGKKTDEQAVGEVMAQIKKLGIVGDECEPFKKTLTEYVILMNGLNSARPV